MPLVVLAVVESSCEKNNCRRMADFDTFFEFVPSIFDAVLSPSIVESIDVDDEITSSEDFVGANDSKSISLQSFAFSIVS